MKTIEKLRQHAARYGAEVDVMEDEEIIQIWLTDTREVWVESGGACISTSYGNGSQRWIRESAKLLIELMDMGTMPVENN